MMQEYSGMPAYSVGSQGVQQGQFNTHPGMFQAPQGPPQQMPKRQRTDPSSIAPGRAIYLSKLPPDTATQDILDLTSAHGSVESVRRLHEKNAAFVNFVHEPNAKSFHDEAAAKGVEIDGMQVQCAWARSKPMTPEVASAIQGGATRCLFVGNLPQGAVEEDLVMMFAMHGEIASSRIIPTKSFGSVNMTSVESAVRAKAQTESMVLGGRQVNVNYAKENTGAKRPSKTLQQQTPSAPSFSSHSGGNTNNQLFQQPQQQQQQMQHLMQQQIQQNMQQHIQQQMQQQMQPMQSYASYPVLTNQPQAGLDSSFYNGQQMGSSSGQMHSSELPGMQNMQGFPVASYEHANQTVMQNMQAFPGQQNQQYPSVDRSQVTRAIFLGGVPLEVTLEDLCQLGNSFGALEAVTLMHEKRFAFINFVADNSALAMFTSSQQRGIQLQGETLTLRWGKARPLHPELLAKIQNGATRCLYLANLATDCTEDTLRRTFEKFAPIVTCVVQTPSKPGAQSKIGFLNLASVKAAIAAQEALDGSEICGRPIMIKFAKEVSKKRPRA